MTQATTPRHVLGIHHVALVVDDLDAARRFYVDQLGLAVNPSRPEFGVPGLWLDAGGEQIHLIAVPDGRAVPEGAPRSPLEGHVALEVDDLAATVAGLEAAGVEMLSVNPDRGAGAQGVLLDPAGNRIELNQPARS